MSKPSAKKKNKTKMTKKKAQGAIDVLKGLLSDHRPFHSEYQIDNFIVGAAGRDVWSQYKQAIRELRQRFGSLKSSYLDRELVSVDLEEFNEKEVKAGSIDERRNVINIVKAEMKREDIDMMIADIEREFRRFFAIALTLKKKLVADHGELSEGVRQMLETQSWLFKAIDMAALDVMRFGVFSPNTIQMIASIPDGTNGKDLFDTVTNRESAVNWLKAPRSRHFGRIDEPAVDVPKLIGKV